MENHAVYSDPVNPRSVSVALVALASMALLLGGLGGLGGNAFARKPIGKDGKIHACYRVKGKPRGALRVVPGARARCRRGERKVAWTVAAAGAAGRSGTDGTGGAQGIGGQTGTSGTVSSTITEQVDSLSARVDDLEATLAGVSNADLTGVLKMLEGIDGEELTGMVESLPAVDSLCNQSEALTEQVNLLQEAIGGLELVGVIGGLLEIPPLPEDLEPFSCPVT
jgi:hypothetical protein